MKFRVRAGKTSDFHLVILLWRAISLAVVRPFCFLGFLSRWDKTVTDRDHSDTHSLFRGTAWVPLILDFKRHGEI